MTSVLVVLLLALLTLCVFLILIGAMNKGVVAHLDQQENHLFKVRATKWYPRLLSSVTTRINDLAARESFKKYGGKIKLLGIEGDVEHGVSLLVGLDLLSELDSEPPAADDEQLLLHISFRKNRKLLNPRVYNGSYQL